MPPSISRGSSADAGARKRTHKEDIDVKRARGEISCAECRRLKLRCDKNIPCSSCIRRGCQVICPNGLLSSGNGSRFVLADTNELHRKIANMSSRIRQLEDALANAHSAISRESHPLLSPELLAVKHSSSAGEDDKTQGHDVTDQLDNHIMRSFGDLTLTECDSNGEALAVPFMERDESTRTTDSTSSTLCHLALPVQVKQLSSSFPFSPSFLPRRAIQEQIEARLPTYMRASSLCETYVQHCACWFRPIGREQLMEELLPAAYKQRRGRTSSRTAMGPDNDSEKMDAHDLAALLMVFAVGAAGDFTLEPSNEEAELYLHLARASLCLKPVLETASVSSVQAVALISMFDMFSWRKRSLESTFGTVSFAMTLAATIGLHRDPTHWNFEPKMIQRRRLLFWELRQIDTWKSIASGRPAGVHSDDVDCELPHDSDATLDENGIEIPSFWRRKYIYLRDVLHVMAHKLTSAKPVKYSEILELDGKIREFDWRDQSKQIAKSIETDNNFGADGVQTFFQKYILSLLKDISLQLLHRNFFARALLETPINPMKSTFVSSFLSCYTSATSLLRLVRYQFNTESQVMLRYWSPWTHAVISAITLGSVAARVPALELAPRAYVELVLSIKTLEKAKSHPAVSAALPAIMRLRERAYRALREAGQNPDMLVKELEPVPAATERANGPDDAKLEQQRTYGPHRDDTGPIGLSTLGTHSTSHVQSGSYMETGAPISASVPLPYLEKSASALSKKSDQVQSDPPTMAHNFSDRFPSTSFFPPTQPSSEPVQMDTPGHSQPQMQIETANWPFDLNAPFDSKPAFDAALNQFLQMPFSSDFDSQMAPQRVANGPGGNESDPGIEVSTGGNMTYGDLPSSFSNMKEPDFSVLLSMSICNDTPPNNGVFGASEGETGASGMNLNINGSAMNVDAEFGTVQGMGFAERTEQDEAVQPQAQGRGSFMWPAGVTLGLGGHSEQEPPSQAELEMILQTCAW